MTGQPKILPDPLVPGVYRGVPFSEYQEIEAVNSSRLKPLLQSALELFNQLAAPDEDIEDESERRKKMKSRILGQGLHAIVGEPETLDREFVQAGECQAVKKTGRNAGEVCGNPGLTYTNGAWWCGTHWCGPSDDARKAMAPKTWATMLSMHRAVMEHPAAGFYHRSASDRELTIVWRDQRTGLLCKGRIDQYTRDLTQFEDYKTTRHVSTEAFGRDAFSMGYYLQLAHYLDGMAAVGLPCEKARIVAVNSAEPPRRCDCIVYELDDDCLEIGRAQLTAAMDRYAALSPDRALWRGVSDDVVVLMPERWMFQRAGMTPPEWKPD